MRYAIVTDIHANLQAWDAVLKDIEKVGVDSLLCLGDVIGYGPSPAQVMELAYEKCDHFVLGNHDAVVGDRLDSGLFNDNAKYIIDWTRNQLSSDVAQFFADMPLRMEGPGFACAHGELAVPGRFGYIYNADDSIASFNTTDHPLMFVGHTHQPAVFTCNQKQGTVQQVESHDFVVQTDLRYLVNAGSVGDPRDGTSKATYVIYDAQTNQVIFRHVPFNVDDYRKDLEKAMLPTRNYFLSVDADTYQETDTLKDMRVSKKSMTKELPRKAVKITGMHTTRQSIKFAKSGIATERRRSSKRRIKKEDLTALKPAARSSRSQVPEKKSKTAIIIGASIVSLLGIIGLTLTFSGEEKTGHPLVYQANEAIKGDTIIFDDAPKPAALALEQSTVEIGPGGGTLLVKNASQYKNGKWHPITSAHVKINNKTILKWRVKFSEPGSYTFSKNSSGDHGETTLYLSSSLEKLGRELKIGYNKGEESSTFQITQSDKETDFIITFPEDSQLDLRNLSVIYKDDGSQYRSQQNELQEREIVIFKEEVSTIRMQAEQYTRNSGTIKEPSDYGVHLAYIDKGHWIMFEGMEFPEGIKTFTARVACGNNNGGTIEFRLGSKTGTLIGSCRVPPTGDWGNWEEMSSEVSGLSGKQDLYLVFTGQGRGMFNLDWFEFDKKIKWKK